MVATVTAQVEAEVAAAAATVQAGLPITIGTTVLAGGSAYTVNEVRDPAPAGSRGVDPDKRAVAVDITQEGIDDGDPYSLSNFFLQDADGYVYEWSGFGYETVEPSFEYGKLATGQRVRGWVSFQVAKSAVLVSVLVRAEGFAPRVVIADLTAGQPSVAPAPTPTLGPDTTPAELVERVKDGVVRVTAGSSGGSGFIFATAGGHGLRRHQSPRHRRRRRHRRDREGRPDLPGYPPGVQLRQGRGSPGDLLRFQLRRP